LYTLIICSFQIKSILFPNYKSTPHIGHWDTFDAAHNTIKIKNTPSLISIVPIPMYIKGQLVNCLHVLITFRMTGATVV